MTASPARVVLVRPQVPQNVGAVARLLGNFGISDWAIVAPDCDIRSDKARRLATHSEGLLESATIAPTLADALQGCRLAVATAARTGGLFRRQGAGGPDDIFPAVMAGPGELPLAFVFGPEPTGLSNEDIALCHYVLHLPTAPVHASLNLSHAVALVLYEWYRRRTATSRKENAEPDSSVAPFEMQERCFAVLRQSLDRLGYLKPERPDALFYGLRHLIARAAPSPMEVNLIFGLARQIEWQLDHSIPKPQEGQDE